MKASESDRSHVVAGLEHASSPRGCVLIVEDDETSGVLLKEMLRSEGFAVVWAKDGEEALDRFGQDGADLVLMDIMMPGMDGYEAAREIKAMSADRFTPVLFVTALDGEDAFTRSIESGGDDFIAKPINRTILQSKICAMERIRDLQRRLFEEREYARALYERTREEQGMAAEIFDRAVRVTREAPSRVRTALWSAAEFNGDLVLHANRPCGGLYVLVGDFTGNGLRAAIGAVPVAEVFRDMVHGGYEAPDVLKQLDRRLRRLLPSDMFMAATLIELSADLTTVGVWNGGMPSGLVLDEDGGVKQRIVSEHPPLGINVLPPRVFVPTRLDVEAGDRVLLYSDGLLGYCESTADRSGGCLEALVERARGGDAFEVLREAIASHCNGSPPQDDITLVELPLAVGGGSPGPAGASRYGGIWRWTLELHSERLRETDPIPLVVNQLKGLDPLEGHRQSLTLVLYELFSNALEHGVLGLDSALKATPDGFERYFEQRKERLEQLESGFVRMELVLVPGEGGGRIIIRVEDSGDGFDFHTVLAAAEANLATNHSYCGRGIPLVRRLCESLTYSGVGSEVEAVYAW